MPATETRAPRVDPALAVILAGVCAALHVGKLPPAVAALQAGLGVTLLQAGFLLAAVQGAGMTLGLAFGALADALGGRRSVIVGLSILAAASALGGAAQSVAPLLALRLAEGFGFLLVVLPAPGLVRQVVQPQRLAKMLGVWGAYMPLATALALLAGPFVIGAWGWRVWWWGLGALTLAAALGFVGCVPASAAPPSVRAGPAWPGRVRTTLGTPGPWLVAVAFATYSLQWMAVIGFLPTIAAEAGASTAAVGVLTALAAGVNMIGNIGAGRLLHRGTTAPRLLAAGYVAMGVAAAAAFLGNDPGADGAATASLRYLALLAFSACGGVVPATLFTLAVRLAPSEGSIGATIGWVQQWCAFGQFVGPPLVAWVAGVLHGWHGTWLVTTSAAAAGLVLTSRIAARLER
jgi:MFS family permease